MAFAPPNTVAQLSHAITIRLNGNVIGAINEWNPRQQRAITDLYELGDGSSGGYSPGVGVPFERVPSNLSGMSVEVRRYDLYKTQMEQAFTGLLGGSVADTAQQVTMLSGQLTAFTVTEAWTFPATLGALGGSAGTGYADLYEGIWFSDLGKQLSATADRIVNVNATLQWTRRTRIPV